MKFPGVLKKEYVEIKVVNYKRSGISKRCSFVLSRISHGKVTNLKIPGVLSKKYALNPCVLIFSGILQRWGTELCSFFPVFDLK